MTPVAWIALASVVVTAIVSVMRITTVINKTAYQMAGKVELNSAMLTQTISELRADIQHLSSVLDKIDERQRDHDRRLAVVESKIA